MYVFNKIATLTVILVILVGCAQQPNMPRSSKAYDLSGRELEELKKSVLKITTKDGEEGFGFVVGECDDKLYVVTANHVVRKNFETPDTITKEVDIEFYQLGSTKPPAIVLEYCCGALDLAVLKVKKPHGYGWDEDHFWYEYTRGEKVWFIGRERKWYVPTEKDTGVINKVEIEIKWKNKVKKGIGIDLKSVFPGTSGAPLVTKDGIIGMIIIDKSHYGEVFAVPIDKIKEALKKEEASEGVQLWGKCPPERIPPIFEFVRIRGGTYIMGGPETKVGSKHNEKQHRVTIKKDFYMQTTEVTQAQWETVMESNPSEFASCGSNCPVENVSWNDVTEFIKEVNDKYRKYCYEVNNKVPLPPKYACRLPTEAEWEYACRAGSTTAYEWGNKADCSKMMYENHEEYHGYDGCVDENRARLFMPNQTAPVKSYKANGWGLYDMHGNVMEWCQDWYNDYPTGHATDPDGHIEGNYRVVRGGSWRTKASNCRSAARERAAPDISAPDIGFRLIMSVE